jgi:hypothetical protein
MFGMKHFEGSGEYLKEQIGELNKSGNNRDCFAEPPQ